MFRKYFLVLLAFLLINSVNAQSQLQAPATAGLLPPGLPIALSVTQDGTDYVALRNFDDHVTLWSYAASTPSPQWHQVVLPVEVHHITSLTADHNGGVVVTSLLSDENNVSLWRYDPTASEGSRWHDLLKSTSSGNAFNDTINMSHNFKGNIAVAAPDHLFVLGALSPDYTLALNALSTQSNALLSSAKLPGNSRVPTQMLTITSPSGDEVYTIGNNTQVNMASMVSDKLKITATTYMSRWDPRFGLVPNLWAAIADKQHNLYLLVAVTGSFADLNGYRSLYLYRIHPAPGPTGTTYQWDRLQVFYNKNGAAGPVLKPQTQRPINKLSSRDRHMQSLVLTSDGRLYLAYHTDRDPGMLSVLEFIDTNQFTKSVGFTQIAFPAGMNRSDYYIRRLWSDGDDKLFAYFAATGKGDEAQQGVYLYQKNPDIAQKGHGSWHLVRQGALLFPVNSRGIVTDPTNRYVDAISDDGNGQYAILRIIDQG